MFVFYPKYHQLLKVKLTRW